MPLRLGPFVISGHRSLEEKVANPTDKERYLAPQPPELVPRRQLTKQPRVEVARLTPYNTFPSFAKVNAKLAKIPITATHAGSPTDVGVLALVKNHLLKHRAANPGQELLVFICDYHGLAPAQSMGMTALHTLGDSLFKQVAVEQEPQTVRGSQPNLQQLERSLRASLLTGSAFDNGAAGGNMETNIFNNNVAYAAMLGYDVKGFDPLKYTARDSDTREASMAHHVAHYVPEKDVTVVMVGTHHLPYLHEKFARTTNTVAVAMVRPPDAGDTESVARLSYLLATPEILKIRTTPQLEAAHFDPTAFSRQLDAAP